MGGNTPLGGVILEQKATTRYIRENGVTLEVYLDPFNKRIRVDQYLGDPFHAIQVIERIAKKEKVEKIIIKSRLEDYKQFIEQGFLAEAIIDGYFLGSDCYFFSKYLKVERSYNNQLQVEEDIITSVQQLKRSPDVIMPPIEYQLKKVSEQEAHLLAGLYREIFQVYPTPLFDPEYIKKTMKDGTIYYAFSYNNEFISAASAEVNQVFRNAELTDCATKKDHRKFGLMKILLKKLEEELFEQGIFCSYSIARSLSFGTNAVLHQLGYRYRGRFINNCYIFDKLEDMNVWVKSLSINQAAEN